MSRFFARIESEKGKVVGTGGDEYLDIDILVGNKYLARLTVRENENGDIDLYDERDALIATTEVLKGK